MANIIKIPCGQNQGQNLLPFSDINHIKTYCTPHNFTYSMTADHEWGEYTTHTPAWATTNYWMNENLVPDISNPTWALTDNGTTVHLKWSKNLSSIVDNGLGKINHTAVFSSKEFTYYIVGKRTITDDRNYALFSLSRERGTGDYPHDPDAFFRICLFCYKSENTDEIGVYYNYGWAEDQYGSRYIQPDSNRNYHIFAFKMNVVNGDCPCTLNVDGTSDSFQIPESAYGRISFFPPGGHHQWFSDWDIKLIAVLDVAESDDVIANNVNILRMIYQ